MINQLNSDATLSKFATETVEEHTCKADFCPSLTKDGKINKDIVANIKVDDYYNSLNIAQRPPSVDNLIAIDRTNDYTIYLIELRDVCKPEYVKKEQVKRKFETTINDFMEVRFKQHFMDTKFKIYKLKLWLISDPFKTNSIEEFNMKMKAPITDFFLSIKPFTFRGIVAMIEPIKPIPIIIK